MKRSTLTVTLLIFACSSIFLMSSCAKKKLVTEESVITARPTEVTKAEKEAAAVKRAQQEEARRAEEVRIEKLEELERPKCVRLRKRPDSWQKPRALSHSQSILILTGLPSEMKQG
jgi:uncharacterized membrane protein YdbT with pleckstrin-like domain